MAKANAATVAESKAGEIVIKGTVVGEHGGVRHVDLGAEGFALVFQGKAPETTKSGQPAWHFGGAYGKPVTFKTEVAGDVVIYGTASIAKDQAKVKANKAVAKVAKALEGVDEATRAAIVAMFKGTAE